ncbi:MAG: ABC transporter ATP-binding protein [Actinomycetota bacterium]
MSELTAIRADHLGKRFRIGESDPYGTLRESLMKGVMAPLRWMRRERSPNKIGADMHVWAVRDASFEIKEGEVVGLIGRNGAGKTTLLKLLSEITEPTEGQAQVRGTLSSLLEVGTGFHPELTGRENVQLNGAILGMGRSQIKRKFDEIVEFAGVARFIDTPIKRYSTGMQVRLAFAVAAHLESDILLVDEVLAVGDLEFQRKCMGRMEEASSMGRTVLFVSHSVASILRLCPRVILLDRGGIVEDGKAANVVKTYLDSGFGTSAHREWSAETAPGDEVARLLSVRVLDDSGAVAEDLDIHRPVDIEVTYRLFTPATGTSPTVTLKFTNDEGTVVFASTDMVRTDWYSKPRMPGVIRSTCRIPGNLLAEGQVFVELILASTNPAAIHWMESDVVAFHVQDATSGEGVRGPMVMDWPGIVRPMLDWRIEAEARSPEA